MNVLLAEYLVGLSAEYLAVEALVILKGNFSCLAAIITALNTRNSYDLENFFQMRPPSLWQDRVIFR